jgi:hypothetical protein
LNNVNSNIIKDDWFGGKIIFCRNILKEELLPENGGVTM